jgi:hypothetical protein
VLEESAKDSEFESVPNIKSLGRGLASFVVLTVGSGVGYQIQYPITDLRQWEMNLRTYVGLPMQSGCVR